ncbi:MAG: prepilin-type N-terminal cleavage/methylation domain-containing protein [Gemmataceae bacterium]|nr:prepilin-type N-terminal cleavage/methylation domain-containing protein [Gemmataceae bacterium]
MRRGGFTLLELMLVMAVMIIALSMAFPVFDALLASSRERAARDLVRARWAEMRARALEEGRPYRFAVTENTGKFRVAPDDEAYWSGRSTGDGVDDRPLIVEGELPQGILFTRDERAFAELTAAPPPGPEWGETIAVYLPDGTARGDAVIYFGKAGQRAIGLHLRGLTGAVTPIDPGTATQAAAPAAEAAP